MALSLKSAFRRTGVKADAPGLPKPLNPTSVYNWYSQVESMSETEMWHSQPHLRSVVSFRARNTAQCGLQTFKRVSDTDRRRQSNSKAANLLQAPNPTTTSYDLIYSLVADLDLYDRAYWYVTEDSMSLSGWRITRIPPDWVIGSKSNSLFENDLFIIAPPETPKLTELPASKVIYFHGYNPFNPREGSSPVRALKETLIEQLSAMRFRNQNWANGGRINGVIERPDTAPEWSDEALNRFMSQWKSRYTGDGAHIGGTPLLEDGMTFKPVDFSARENEFLGAAQLALATVCQVYGVVPGLLTGDQNYSNSKSNVQMLYSEILGPLMAQIEATVNNMLLPMIGEPRNNYVEFNIQEKLQGSFQEQAASFSVAAGGPWMSTNEVRATLNMPQLDDPEYDKVITQLNTVRGGGDQANPQDSAPAPEDRTGPGDSQPEQQPKAAPEDFIEHFVQSARSKLGAGIPLEKAWNDEKFCSTLAEFMDFEHAKEVNTEAKAALLAATEASNAE